MNITPLILAGLVQATEPIPIPMTQELYNSIQQSVASSLAVCKKVNIAEKLCMETIEEKMKGYRALADKVCKEYPKEVIPCIQFGLGQMMDSQTRTNILILNAKSI